MANMTTEQIVENIQKNCGVGKFGGNLPSSFFVGATNNPERRKAEHNINDFVDSYTMFKKEYAQDVLTKLAELGFDMSKQIGNGQDDSLWVYVYQKTLMTTEILSASFDLEFEKCWYNENDYEDAPDTEGIYICLSCDKKLSETNTYQSHGLIYIGMTDKQGFKTRIGQHIAKDHANWKKLIDTSKEQLVYAIAPLTSQLLQTIESALIFKNQPKANSEYMDHYQGEYAEVTVNCSGYHGGKLKKSITAHYEE